MLLERCGHSRMQMGHFSLAHGARSPLSGEHVVWRLNFTPTVSETGHPAHAHGHRTAELDRCSTKAKVTALAW